MSAVLSYLVQMTVPACIGALLWALFLPWRRNRRRLRKERPGSGRECALLVYFMFLAGLLGLTLTPAGFWPSVLRGEMPSLPPAFQGGLNLTPFHHSWSLLQYYVRHELWEAVLVNFPGNVLIFVPVGFFIALLSDRPRWWKGTLGALFLSMFIEVFQLFVSRGTDVDDLILNTAGGILGHGCFLLLQKAAPDVVLRCSRH